MDLTMNINLKIIDQSSFRLLETVLEKENTNNFEQLLEEVLSKTDVRESVLDYSVLNYILLRKNHFLDEKSKKDINSALISLWKKLVDQKELSNENIQNKRLPRYVLSDCTRKERLIHEAAFAPDKVLKGFESLKYLLQNYFPKKNDYLYCLIIFLTIFLPGVNSLAIGLACGYCFSSIIEHYAHLHIGHGAIGNNKKSSWFWDKMSRFYLEHSVHHGAVKLNYTKPFANEDFSNSKEDENYIKLRLKRARVRAYNKGGMSLVKNVIKSEYGLRSSNTFRSHYSFAPITIVALMLMLPLLIKLPVYSTILFSLGFLSLSQLWVPTSEYFHSYLHCSEAQALKMSKNGLMTWFLKTRFARLTARLHKVHHDIRGKYNQNLNLGFGLLTGWKPLNLKGLLELMRREAIY